MRRFVYLAVAMSLLGWNCLAAPAPQQAASTITIQVTDKATGEPIAQAAVNALGGRSITNDYGQCTVAVPLTGYFNFAITVSQPGYASMATRWRRIRDGQKLPSQLSFAMEPGTSIGGNVVDETGKPVAHATVHLSEDNLHDDHSPHPELNADTQTDAAGKWVINSAPARLAQVSIQVTHPDFYDNVYLDTTPIEKLRDRSAVIMIQHGVVVKGKVFDPTGNAVAGAMVTASDDFGQRISHRTRTDSAGEFTLTQMMPGGATFCVRASGFAPAMVSTFSPTTRPVEVHLQTGSPLQLHVVDLTGKPLDGVAIKLGEWHGTKILEYQMHTNANGDASWLHAPTEEVKFDITKPGFGEIVDRPITATIQPITIALGPRTRIIGTVIDAATNQPIKNFTYLCGLGWGDDQDIYLDDSPPHAGHDGHFTYSLGDVAYAQYAMHLEAPGYLSCVSRRFTQAEGDLALQFKMEKGAPIMGTVYTPNHQPATGTKIILVSGADQWVEFDNGKLSDLYIPASRVSSITSDAQGHFTFPARSEAFDLICMTDTGYAELDVPAAHSSGKSSPTTRPHSYDLAIWPWASVNGTLMIGSHPAAGAQVRLSNCPTPESKSRPRINLFYTAITNSAGHFQFPFVPPGQEEICRAIPHGDGTAFSNDLRILAKPGETATVQIGGTGRPIVGHFKFPPGAHPESWMATFAGIDTHIDLPPMPTMPITIQHGPAQAKQKWFNDWLQSPQGKAYQSAEAKTADLRHHYALQIQPDGSFRADDVPAGIYDINAHFIPAGAMTSQTLHHSLGDASQKIVVPPMAVGRSDELLDIGSIPVTAREQSN